MGAEKSKHHGIGSSPNCRGLAQFFDCCEGEAANAPGCATGKHCSYDDDYRQVLLIRSKE